MTQLNDKNPLGYFKIHLTDKDSEEKIIHQNLKSIRKIDLQSIFIEAAADGHFHAVKSIIRYVKTKKN